MTFTRKAAAEMRERVLKALREAETEPTSLRTGRTTGHPSVGAGRIGTGPERRNWQLLSQPSRLRMLTIDALAASLARQAPVTTGLGALPDLSTTRRSCTSKAYARHSPPRTRMIRRGGASWPVWTMTRTTLSICSRRCLRDAISGCDCRSAQGTPNLRGELEQALRMEIETALARTRAMFPASLAARLAESPRYAAAHLEKTAGREDAATTLTRLAEQGGIPPPAAEALPSWHALTDFLLTRTKQEPAFRKVVNARNGFPAKGQGTRKRCKRVAAKQAMMDLLRSARDIPGPGGILEFGEDIAAPDVRRRVLGLCRRHADSAAADRKPPAYRVRDRRRADFSEAYIARPGSTGQCGRSRRTVARRRLSTGPPACR